MPDAAAAVPVPRALIATASESSRAWFAAFPAKTDGLSIVGIAAVDTDLSTRVQDLAPDVVVLDVTDTDAEGLTQLLESVGDPTVDIVVVANVETWRTRHVDLIAAGVRAILSHHPTREELEAAVRAIGAGLVVFDPDALVSLPAPTTTGNDLATAPLTPREIDVLNALAEGLANKHIAERLAISEHTVKTHLAAIFEKLEASNRTEAVMTGAKLGLVML